MTSPCENCPYRLDAPRRHWAREEFEGVLRSEASYMGALYTCHKHAALPENERGFCAGWLLNQKARNIPSIKLRIQLCYEPDAAAAMQAVNTGGLRMFRTVKAMCRANGVRQ